MTKELIRQDHNKSDIERLIETKDTLSRFLDKEVKPSDPEWMDGFNAILRFQDEDGSFNLLDSFKIPNDASVSFCYMPTYICTAIIMKAFMIDADTVKNTEVLSRALKVCCRRNLGGHGYDSFAAKLDALDIFRRAGVREFLLHHSDICPEFSHMMAAIIRDLFRRARQGFTKGAWGEDYSPEIDSLVDYFSHYIVFVYGTLMQGRSNHDYYLGGKEMIDDATLDGFDMYDIGSFPGIVPGDGVVKGELYEVSEKELASLDYLEGEGSLYIRRCVPVTTRSGKTVLAQVYIYNSGVAGLEQIPEALQPYTSDWRSGLDRYVWYVSYGSNMLKERFLRYIKGGSFRGSRCIAPCSDTSDPIAVRPYIIPHNMYFAKSSSSWDWKGVSFLDITTGGQAYGVAYLITKDQFEHVCREENGGAEITPGSWYNKKFLLGEMDGIEVCTLTNSGRFESNAPSDVYLETLREGLKTNYTNLSHSNLNDYLYMCCHN